MRRVSRYGLSAIVIGFGLTACGGGGGSSSSGGSTSSTSRPSVGATPTRSASLMTTDDGARALSAALVFLESVEDISVDPAGAVTQFRSAGVRSASTAEPIPQQRATINCGGGGRIETETSSETSGTADFIDCTTVDDNPPVRETTVVNGRISLNCSAGVVSSCSAGTLGLGNGGTTLLIESTETNSGNTTDSEAGQLLGSADFVRASLVGGGSRNNLNAVDMVVDVQDLLNNTQLTVDTNPAVANPAEFKVEVQTDGNNEPQSGKVDGTYSVGNLNGCQDGVLTVVTDVDLIFTSGQVTGGQLTFTNENMEMAQVTFQSNGEVVVNAGGSMTTYSEAQISAFCNL